MKLTKLILFSGALLLASSTFAQKIKVTSGNLHDLKGVDKMKVVFDYSNLSVGKFKNEDDYVAKKMADADKKQAGSGADWKARWLSDRTEKYEPRFLDYFSKSEDNIKSGKDIEAEVVMYVHTTFIEPGYNVGVSSKPAYVDFIVTFKKGDTEIASLTILKTPGSGAMGYDFDAALRISEAYGRAGKVLGSYIMKATKK